MEGGACGWVVKWSWAICDGEGRGAGGRMRENEP